MTDKVDYLAWRREEEAKNKVYFDNAHKIAVHDALVAALQDVAQTLDWMQNGKCRGFSDGLLSTNDALEKARAALKLAKD